MKVRYTKVMSTRLRCSLFLSSAMEGRTQGVETAGFGIEAEEKNTAEWLIDGSGAIYIP